MSRATRPERTSNGVRNIMTVKGKEPGFTYRWVNDTDDRISEFEEIGYEVVKDKTIKVGDKRVNSPSADGTPVQKSVGGGTQAFLMRIKDEFYQEDQAAKQKRIAELEASLKTEAQAQGLIGKLELSRS